MENPINCIWSLSPDTQQLPVLQAVQAVPVQPVPVQPMLPGVFFNRRHGESHGFCWKLCVFKTHSFETYPMTHPWDDCIFTDPWMVDFNGFHVGKYTIFGSCGICFVDFFNQY